MRRAQPSLFGAESTDDIVEGVRAAALKRIVWTDGVELLVASGVSDSAARSFLGQRVRDVGADAMALGIASAIVRRVREPRSYLGAIKPLPSADESPRPYAPSNEEVEYDPGFFENEAD